MASAVNGNSINPPCFIAANHDSLSEIQNQTCNIALSNFSKSAQESSPPKCSLSLIELPADLIPLILHMPCLKDILNLRLVCPMLQRVIDSDEELQPLISYEKLKIMPAENNIPIDDLKFDYTDGKLSVEVNNNLCLWKLTHTHLKQTLTWITHLIVKGGKPEELLELFNQLKQNQRLTKMFLSNCELDANALNSLKQLENPYSARIPDFYCCDLKTLNCEPPSYGPHLSMVESDQEAEYCIDQLVTKDSDRIALKKFSEQLAMQSPSGEQIVQNLESLKSVIKRGIISSIWFSAVMPVNGTNSSFSNLAVTTFISMNPQHPAISAALNQALKKSQL